ncbi:histidinol phosphate aminotransferase apoenzyme [Micromonospora viridifaciens]|uniref:Aminotransferase n=1 Tax=Micromonospora viridifaciens TaxID=1881 RepID=A0A1C4WV34_MICVI|nr:histidinol-phosphate transaminase [Micromonospora viridifaciens]SCF00058.1 histidinol phosphate aminotransferase apoenzyme [Micromonospora viridifaciens]
MSEQQIHRAAANESPYPPPQAVRDAVAAASTRINRYPEVYPTELARAIAAHHGVPVEQVAVGAGGAGLIQQMLHLVARGRRRGEVLFAWRSFEGYPLIAEGMGVPVRRIPLRGHAHDLDAMARAVRRRTKLIFLGSPNNPTGTAIRQDELDRFLARVPRRVFVVLDEVYRDYATDPATADGLATLAGHPNLVVLRSFSKSYGLAGLRVGYAIGHPGPIAGLRGVTMPFLVPEVAQAAAIAALAVEPEYAARRRAIAAERDRVTRALRAAGIPVPDSEGNFVWLPLGERTAAFEATCRAEGLLVHAFPGEGARVSIGLPESNDLLLKVASSGTVAGP